MRGPLIDLVRAEHRSRHEGPVPPPHELVWLPWVGPSLRVFSATRAELFPPPVRPLDADQLCACGHPASEHPLGGACASCGCAGHAEAAAAQMRQEG